MAIKGVPDSPSPSNGGGQSIILGSYDWLTMLILMDSNKFGKHLTFITMLVILGKYLDPPKPFIYQAKESSLVPEGFLTIHQTSPIPKE